MQFGTFDCPELGSHPFEELSAKEATAVAAVAAASIPAALDRVAQQIGPPDESDTAASLRKVWTWLLDQLPATELPAKRSWWRRGPDRASGAAALTWDDVDPSTLPYWCWFSDGSGIFLPLGPRICLDVEAVGAYVVTLLAAIHPGSEIVRCSGRPNDVDYRKPALCLPDGREYMLPGRHVIDASRALDPDDSFHALNRDPDRLIDKLRVWIRPLDPAPSPPVRVFDVVARKQGAFSFLVNVDEEVAHEHSDRLDQVVAAVVDEDGVDHAHREDREVLLLAAPTPTPDQVEGLLDRIWESLNP